MNRGLTDVNPPTVLPSTRVAATVFSLLAALVHFLIALGFVPADFQSPPALVMFVAGFSYLIGGLLILRVGRRLLVLGAAVNLLVMIAFIIAALAGNATVEPLGIIGKLAQVSLGLLLLWLVIPRVVPHQTQ